MKTNQQNEFLLAEIDWLEEELGEKARLLLDRISFINDLNPKYLLSLSKEILLGNRLNNRNATIEGLLVRNAELVQSNFNLKKQVKTTKWYHLLFNIKP